MARLMAISGMDLILRNLKKVEANLGKGFHRGQIKAGHHLQRASMKIVPIQTGNLRGAAYTRNVGGTGFRADIVVGYDDSAGYAIFVHEDLEAAHGEAFNRKYRKEIAAAAGTRRGTARGGFFNRGKDQQAKFLEKPAREERPEILAIIKREARLI